MPEISINKEKCVKCGMCAKDCITYSIDFDSENYPQMTESGRERCISCTHCMAICPTGALSFNGKNPEEASQTNYANPEDVLGLIKSRRSIRHYKDEEISEETFKKLKEMFPYIPTGCNTNTLHFSIIESKSAMDKIRNYVNKKMLNLITSDILSPLAKKFAKYKTAFENGEDIIFRGAPHMVIVSSSIKAPCANVDPIIALSYLELYAQSLGLGTCWCGFAQACMKLMPKLSMIADIPEGYKPVYVMLLGIPAVKYPRTTMPESFPISEIKDIAILDYSWKQKIKRFFTNLI